MENQIGRAATLTPGAEPLGAPDVHQRLGGLTQWQPLDEYNFEHFRTRHLAYDAQATVRTCGIQPGEIAPDFELPRVGGGTFRLSEHRQKPVLLHFGSYT